ncbi:hypothetical protein CBR_g50601 [Chara braunii]|uniref:FAS1 domain-containing protein n=1 Tax=Chara braunii TaxID=69332 RepID=A0A388M793_CHABU|nr:hypothetical protein CBR_g50601 [Chara braunii]|eukprot:GBG90353.1 hypothetical protein CBR_g50601 [Chara braunii]
MGAVLGSRKSIGAWVVDTGRRIFSEQGRGGRRINTTTTKAILLVTEMAVAAAAVFAMFLAATWLLTQPVMAQQGQPSIPDLIQQSSAGKNLSLFAEGLRSLPNVLQAMENQRQKPEGVTIFAPTDVSLLATPEAIVRCLEQSPREKEILTAFKLSHAIPVRLPMDALTTTVSQSPNGKFLQPTLAGGDSSAVVIRQAASRYPGANTGIFVDDAQILPDGSDVVTAAGVVVHVIDRPILTPNVVQMIEEACPMAVACVPPPPYTDGA